MLQKVLEIKNLSKSYKKRTVVNNISFSVFESEIFGFIGTNGAGKSTTIKMVTGLAKIDSGEVFICGKSVKKEFTKAIENVGAIIESPEMYNFMTGYENLLFFARLHKNVTRERIMEVVNIVGLTNRINEKVKNYSMGMKQRLGIAQAILHKPKLLILDEPTNGLDAYGIVEVRNMLKKLAKQDRMAILISSHILAELEQICDTIAIIKDGSIVELKSLKELQKSANEGNKIAIKVDYPNFAGKLIIQKFGINVEVAGSEVVCFAPEKEAPSLMNYLISKNISVFNVRAVTKTLEQIFMDIVSNSKGGK